MLRNIFGGWQELIASRLKDLSFVELGEIDEDASRGGERV